SMSAGSSSGASKGAPSKSGSSRFRQGLPLSAESGHWLHRSEVTGATASEPSGPSKKSDARANGMTDRGASPRAVLIFDLHHISAAAQHHSAVGSNAASDGSAERSPNGSPHWYTSISPLPLSR